MKIDALGFVELLGYVAAIEAADAMLKTADVRLLAVHEVNPGLITVQVEGNLAACRVAVNAGRAAAERVGTVIATHVIGRPDPDTEDMVLHHMGNGATRKATPSVPTISTEPNEQGNQSDAATVNAIDRPVTPTQIAQPTPRKNPRSASVNATHKARSKVSATATSARPSRSAALPKEQLKADKQLRADKQGKAMAQAARQWADALLGEMGEQDAGNAHTADAAMEDVTPIQRSSKSKRAAVKK